MEINIPAIAILLGSFFGLIILRIPIAFCLGISSVLTGFYLQVPLAMLAQGMVRGINSFSLMAIPFFILSGEIMSLGSIGIRLIQFSNACIGQVRGGMALVNILASMFFGGISGSSVADTSSIGALMIPMMNKRGYDRDYSVSVTISGSTIGILIPPSHNMIIYALAAGSGVSVATMFMAGIVPGVFLGLALMVISYFIAVKRNYPVSERFTMAQKWKAFKDSFLGLFTFVIVVVGVCTGFYTATEAAAVAVLYAFIVTFFIYRDVPLSTFPIMLKRSLGTLAIVMGLIATASSFGWMLAYLKIPEIATAAITAVSSNKYVILLIINILLLILGCIMDMAPLILITTPILLPVINLIGMSPIHFGIVLMLNLSIGLLTPPVGSTLFVGCALGKCRIEDLARTMVPFYITMITVLMFLTYIPDICLAVPKLMGLM